MAKYRLTEDGCVDTEVGHSIPNDNGNRHWREYQEWLAADVANVPDPEPVPVPPTDAQLLSMTDVKMIRAIDWILEQLVKKDVLTTAEIPPALRSLYLERKAQRSA
jgi:hypothetical protein